MSSPSESGKWIRLAICIVVGAIIWNIPVPEAVNEQGEQIVHPFGWRILAVFVATILSFILRPIPMATSVLIGLLVLTLTQSLAVKPEGFEGKWSGSKESLKVALNGYGNTTVWLVVAAFLISGAVIQSGLGRRISLFLIKKLGRGPIGMAWGIGAAELTLGPFVPSNTARGGGILAPIVDSLCRTLGSKDDVEKKAPVNQFLILCGAHANLITAAMFVTGMAANPIVLAEAEKQGIDFGLLDWAIGASVPGLLGLFLLPLFLRFLVPPTGIDVSSARDRATEELKQLGAMSYKEKILICVFVGLLGFWATAKIHHIHTTVIALAGVVTLLVTGVQSWKDMAKNYGAWDAMVWLGGLVLMAGLLRNFGVMEWFADNAKHWVGSMGLAGIGALIVLALIYFYSMYGFSMLTGHITAMVGLFLGVALLVDAPPVLSVAILAYFSNLCGCLTNYSTGPVVIYFGMDYVTGPRWMRVGALVSIFHLVIWLGVGMLWWKLLGWW